MNKQVPFQVIKFYQFKKIDNIISKEDLIDGLKLTEFFLNKRVYSQQAKNLSSSRIRLVEYLKNNSVING